MTRFRGAGIKERLRSRTAGTALTTLAVILVSLLTIQSREAATGWTLLLLALTSAAGALLGLTLRREGSRPPRRNQTGSETQEPI